MSQRQDAIRRIYRRHRGDQPFDALWDWARRGDGKRERYRRFRALQRWAQGHRKRSHGDERHKWNNRRKIYRRQARRILRRINDSPKPGTGPWQGTQSIVEGEILPVYARHGIAVTSTKRWATFGNPGSDHYMGNTDAYAADGAIATAHWLRGEIAAKMRLGRTPADYEAVYFQRAGKTFRLQMIAATHGTGPHFHSGVKH